MIVVTIIHQNNISGIRKARRFSFYVLIFVHFIIDLNNVARNQG